MKSGSFILGTFLCMFLFSCSTNEESENLEQGFDSEAIKLESSKGFKVANSLGDLKVRIGDNRGIAVASIAVEGVEYVDLEEVSVAFVNYINKETGEVSNIAIARGEFTYDADHLRMSDISSPEIATSSEDVEISCDGCTNCRVQGYRDAETGNYHFSCESSCCTMTVRQLPREP